MPRLSSLHAGSVLLPGDAGYDEEPAVWNLNHERVLAVIVVPESAVDVQAAVTFAAGQHRPVLVKTTGHQIVGQAHDAVVIATRRMNDVAINDPDRRQAAVRMPDRADVGRWRADRSLAISRPGA
jgi:FAD/FMN-containing dehydrogenase